jgi:hypothetical protein
MNTATGIGPMPYCSSLGIVFVPTGERAFASILRRTIYRSKGRGEPPSGDAFTLIVIAGNPKTGRRMTFLIASLCILIFIILTILLLRDDRAPWTPSTLHPSTFLQSSAIN